MAREPSPPSPTASSICDALGRSAIADRLGVQATAVSNASVAGTFPASWFTALRAMCSEAGLVCPESLFRFKATSAPDATEQQGAA